MRTRDIEIGKTYLVKYVVGSDPRARGGKHGGGSSIYVSGWSPAKVVEKIKPQAGGYWRIKVEWPGWRWDYENRPEGWSEVRWMIDEESTKKKVWAPKYELVLARNVQEAA